MENQAPSVIYDWVNSLVQNSPGYLILSDVTYITSILDMT